MIRQLQWAQTGARAWMAHSKLSKTRSPPSGDKIRKALSYVFPQVSQLQLPWIDPPARDVVIETPLRKRGSPASRGGHSCEAYDTGR